MYVKLREIDFKLKIAQATTLTQKQKWLQKLQDVDDIVESSRKEKEELEELERQAAEIEKEAKIKDEKN